MQRQTQVLSTRCELKKSNLVQRHRKYKTLRRKENRQVWGGLGLSRENPTEFHLFQKNKKNGTDICHICHNTYYLSSVQALASHCYLLMMWQMSGVCHFCRFLKKLFFCLPKALYYIKNYHCLQKVFHTLKQSVSIVQNKVFQSMKQSVFNYETLFL